MFVFLHGALSSPHPRRRWGLSCPGQSKHCCWEKLLQRRVWQHKGGSEGGGRCRCPLTGLHLADREGCPRLDSSEPGAWPTVANSQLGTSAFCCRLGFLSTYFRKGEEGSDLTPASLPAKPVLKSADGWPGSWATSLCQLLGRHWLCSSAGTGPAACARVKFFFWLWQKC